MIEVRHARHLDDRSTESIIRPAGPHSIPWRKVGLIATPFLLSLVNPVEARFEKQRAIATGNNQYERLCGVGLESKRIAIEEGKSVGEKEYQALVESAEARRPEIALAFEREAAARLAQGSFEGYMQENQAAITKTILFGLRHLSQISLEMAQIEAENDHGILLEINDAKLYSEASYPVTKIEYRGATQPTAERRKQLQARLAQLQKDRPQVLSVMKTMGGNAMRTRVLGTPCLSFPSTRELEKGVTR